MMESTLDYTDAYDAAARALNRAAEVMEPQDPVSAAILRAWGHSDELGYFHLAARALSDARDIDLVRSLGRPRGYIGKMELREAQTALVRLVDVLVALDKG